MPLDYASVSIVRKDLCDLLREFNLAYRSTCVCLATLETGDYVKLQVYAPPGPWNQFAYRKGSLCELITFTTDCSPFDNLSSYESYKKLGC